MIPELEQPPKRTMSPDQLLGCRDDVMRTIATEQSPSRSGRPLSRRRILALVVVPAAALAIAAGVAVLQTGPVLNVTCLDADGDGVVIGADGRNPLDICTQLWADGSVDARVSVVPDALTACASNDGVMVFPDADPSRCENEGLRPLPGDYQAVATRFAAMRDDLAGQWPFGTCAAKADAVEMIRGTLDAHGYEDWTIQVRGFKPSHPCADFVFDPGRGSVLVVGTPPPD